MGTLRPVLTVDGTGGSGGRHPGNLGGGSIVQAAAGRDAAGAAASDEKLRASKAPPTLTSLPDTAIYHQLGGYYEALLWRHGTDRLVLGPFSPEDARQYISAALSGVAVSDAAAQLFWEKSAGLPGYLHQIATYLKMQAEGGEAEATLARGSGGGDGPARGGSGAGKSAAPEVALTAKQLGMLGMDFVRATVNVHSIVPAHVDRLRPDEQLTLKVASVMGTTVYADLLAAAHPQRPGVQRVEADLRALRAGGFVRRDPGEATWHFRDVLARDVVYDLIPVAQRRGWHARLAAAMEEYSRHSGEAAEGGAGRKQRLPAATVAYHWTQACREVVGEEVRGSPGSFNLRATRRFRAPSASATRPQNLVIACFAAWPRPTPAAWCTPCQPTQCAVALQWRCSLNAAASWEQAAAEAAGSGAYAEASALLQRALELADALAEHAAVRATPTVPRWRRARWERCAAAMLLSADRTGGKGDAVKGALVHCLRALALLGVALPWSRAYQAGSGRLASATIVWDRAIAALASGCGRAEEAAGAGELRREALSQAVRDLAVLSTLDSVLAVPGSGGDGGGGETPESPRSSTPGAEAAWEGTLVMRALCAALLTPAHPDAPSVRYALWACRALEGGRVRRSSPLYPTYRLLDGALRCRAAAAAAAPAAALLGPLQDAVGMVKGGSGAVGRVVVSGARLVAGQRG